MNKISIGFLSIAVFFSAGMAYAAPTHELNKAREEVIKQYILDLQNANYKDITQLFAKNGTVISTSRGTVDAKTFFYSFLPDITTANTALHHLFLSTVDANHLSARFHFAFKMKDGEKGSGEYIDEFIFSEKSTKLISVYMFENLKFGNREA